MKRLLTLSIAFIIAAAAATVAEAQNRWNIYAGGNISHLCETAPMIGSDRSFGWGGGAFAGAGYEINFNSHSESDTTDRIGLLKQWRHPLVGRDGFQPQSCLMAQHPQSQYPHHSLVSLSGGRRGRIASRAPVHACMNRLPVGTIAPAQPKGEHVGLRGRPLQYRSNRRSGSGDRIALRVYAARPIPDAPRGWTRRTVGLSLGVRYSF